MMTACESGYVNQYKSCMHASMCLFILVILYFCFSAVVGADDKIVLISEVEWEHLNPARGDKSPQAGTLWGTRNGIGPTGFLVKFKDGFSSPPHIHNVSYRGVVIKGHIHNDDPNAEKMWMPSGSFWTQPAGESHITAAMGEYNLAYIEIDKGPYLVLPVQEIFDNGERPINIDQTNIVWIDPPENAANSNELKIAYLWGTPGSDHLFGALIQLPKQTNVNVKNTGSVFHAVVISGQVLYQINKDEIKNLNEGSYFTSEATASHNISNNIDDHAIIYVRTNAKLEFTN